MPPVRRQPESSGTVRPDEAARFAAVAGQWWDPDGAFKPLHRMNGARVAYVRDRATAHFGRSAGAARPLTGIRVVDIGCGGGLMSEAMARLGASVTGIDADPTTVEVARRHARETNLRIDYRLSTPEEFLAASGPVSDLVLTMEVVEHVTDLRAFMIACGGLVAPGGAMALSTINRTLKSLALAKIGAEYVLGWLPRGTHEWRRFVRPSELAASLRAGRLELTDLRGLSYAPFSGDWRLGNDIDVNYMAFATASR